MDLLIAPVVLGAHRHVLIVFQLSKRVLDLTLSAIGEQDFLV